jgi:hypothetical protein
MKQTAVEWLKKRAEKREMYNPNECDYWHLKEFQKDLEQAKEMEKEQKTEAKLEILNLLQKNLDGNNTEENNLWHKINKLKETFKQQRQ